MAIDKQKLILIGGIVLAIMAVILAKMYLDQKEQAIKAQAKAAIANIQSNQTSVLVAKQNIASGVAITPEMFDTSIVPNKFVQPQAVTSLGRIEGMVTVAPISSGEQITLSKLSQERKADTGGLSGATPSGKRAISIVADSIASLSGMVKAGDYVDVLAILQIPYQGNDGKVTGQTTVVPLFQNVLVLAVGQNMGNAALARSGGRYAESAPAAPSGGNTLITLALEPQEANLVAFVQEQGKMRLVMRSPADAKIEPITPATWDTFFQHIAPPQPEYTAQPMVDTNEYIEVLRGLSKEKVALSK